MGATLRIKTARVFVPLLKPSRYKAIHGGRGSAKSHFVADKLIEDSLAEPGDSGGEGLRTVCIREVQKDLAQSSKALIESKLRSHGLGEQHKFKVFRDVIQTPGNGIIIFKGMNDFNADSIKSLEGFKRSWWEEAQNASSTSLALLRPTLRAPGSELLFTWNPRRKTDAIDVLFRGEEKPTDAIVVQSNWRDNPWFPRELEQERLDCLRMTPDQYDHIWEGGYVSVMSGAYYAKDIALAKSEGRVGVVGPDPLMTKRAFVDIGGTGARADSFVMWIVQFVGLQVRMLNYYEAVGQPLATHLTWLRTNGYTPDTTQIWLPHDGQNQERIYDASFESKFKEAEYKVTVVPNQGAGAAKARIEAMRRVWPAIWINEATCSPGLDALGWYHEKRDTARGIGLGPEHDWASHASDAAGMMAIMYEDAAGKRKPKREPLKYRKVCVV